MKKYVTISLGCKVNAYEISALSSRLEENGYIYDENNPDVAIINTCSVTSVADQKSRQHIRRLMNKYPDAIIAVMGCYAQGQHKFISETLNANIVSGTSNRDLLLKEILKADKSTHIDLTDEKTRLFKYEELGITNLSENVRAYLKIQDGCDNFCSYCLIPLRRGKARNRNHCDILKEANYLVKKGYKEIVLTGIHVGGYGKDEQTDSFSNLVNDILKIKDLYRLRISSIEESEIDDRLIETIKTNDKLANHFHIPLQAGSDTILKRMNRKYTKAEFLNKIKAIKKACPNVALTTDVIVGFPGESNEEFLETVEFIKECEFDMLHVFPYSARENTVAARLPNQIDPKIKKERVKVLYELSNELWDKYTNKFVDKEVEVLIEQYDEINHVNIGHTSNYIEVKIPSDHSEVGKVVKTIYKKY